MPTYIKGHIFNLGVLVQLLGQTPKGIHSNTAATIGWFQGPGIDNGNALCEGHKVIVDDTIMIFLQAPLTNIIVSSQDALVSRS